MNTRPANGCDRYAPELLDDAGELLCAIAMGDDVTAEVILSRIVKRLHNSDGCERVTSRGARR